MDKSKAKARRRPPIPNMTILTINGAKVQNGCLIKILKRMNASSKSDAEYQCEGVGIRTLMIRTVLAEKLSLAWLKSAMVGERAIDGESTDCNDRSVFVDLDHTLHLPKAFWLLHEQDHHCQYPLLSHW